MTYIAKLVSIAKYKNLTDKFKPFVHFHSELENVEILDNDRIAILQIESTESYFPIFLKTKPTIEQIEEKLTKQKTKLNSEARKLLLKYIEEEQK